MSVDLHNHTILCNHATGSIEEYVLKAIKEQIKYFGFADHAPMKFDTNYRMSFDNMPIYEKEVLHVKEKYKNEIDILLAYEVDYLDGYIDNKVLSRDVDYLIGSVHFIDKWGFDNPEFIGQYKNKNIDKIWEEYFEAIEAMAKSNLFNIVGHIDLIKVFNFLPKKDIKLIAQKAIKAIKKANMTVEINAAGLRKPVKELYPSSDIMELVAQYDIPITFASDAHKVEQIGFKKDKLYQYAKSFGYSTCNTFIKKEPVVIKF